jgi:alpha-1,3-rhamnosyl/mannosyltransferase
MSATVGLNLLWLVPGAVGGSEQSTLATLRALRDLAPPDLDLRLFVLEPFAAAHPDIVRSYRSDVLPVSGRWRPVRVASEASWLPARTRGVDLLHHAGGTAPPWGAPYVLTIHDLQPLEHQATHGRGKRAYLRAVLPRSVRRARAVAVPSEFVRRSVIARFGADPARVVAIPHGVAAVAPGAATPAEVVRARYRLDGPVVLYPAITYPHKNHVTLIEAFAQLRAQHPEARLVLTGGEGSCEAAVLAQIERLQLHDHVRRLGRIPDEDVAGLFSIATVIAVPSTYEGFGLPVAEAMAAGVALVAADATALPEVVGDAGLLVDARDPEAWAEAIGGLLSDPDARVQLAERGRDRVVRYSWSANAEAFADLYRAALATP